MPRKKKKKKVLDEGLELLLKGSGIGKLSEQPEVMVVPTDFVGLNRATRIGGVPVSCIMLVYGPSQGGKTAFALGLVKSFQRRGHLACYVDAEFTLDVPWAVLCGIDPGLPYFRPETYQEARKKVHQLVKNYVANWTKGKIHPNRALVVVIDSLTKLVPKEEATKTEIGKAFPLRALFNSIWLDQITPTVHKYPILFVLIAHQKEKINAEQWEDAKRHKGGSALYFDSSMVVNIYTRKVIRQKDAASPNKKATVEVAILHEGFVEKNKLGVCHEKFPLVMSTGRGPVPVGFDLVREVMLEAEIRGGRSPMVRKTGGVWVSDVFPEGRMRGEAKVRAFLRENPSALKTIVDELDKRALDSLETLEEDEGEGDEE